MKESFQIHDESGDKKYFTIIPNYILNHSTLWDREVYIQMKRIAGENGTCWTSRKKLAAQCGMSLDRLKKSIKYLLEHKWIEKIGNKKVQTKGGLQEVNEYKVIDLWQMNNDFYKAKGGSSENTPITKGGSSNEPKGGRQIAKGGSSNDYKEEPLNNIPIKEELAKQSFAVEINEIINLFKPINPSYEKFFKNTTQRGAIERLLKKIGRQKLEGAIKFLQISNNEKYAPTIITPLQLEDKFASLVAYANKEKNKKMAINKAENHVIIDNADDNADDNARLDKIRLDKNKEKGFDLSKSLLNNLEKEYMYYYDDIKQIRRNKYKNKISQATKSTLIKVGLLWVDMASNKLGLAKEEVPIKNIYYPIRACWDRNPDWGYNDFQELFKFFLNSKIKEEDKISFDLCLSEKYVAKFKLQRKNKKETNASISGEIKL